MDYCKDHSIYNFFFKCLNHKTCIAQINSWFKHNKESKDLEVIKRNISSQYFIHTIMLNHKKKPLSNINFPTVREKKCMFVRKETE